MNTITYAPPCWACDFEKNPIITDECTSCGAPGPHEMPGTELDAENDQLHLPTVRRMVSRMNELGGRWTGHILMGEVTRGELPLVVEESREKQIAGLRALADFLEANPDIKNPHEYGGHIYFYGADSKEQMTRWRRRAGGTWEKGFDYAGDFTLTGNVGGHAITLNTRRENVCTRRVVGTRTETVREYPEGALVDIEMIEVEKEVEIVEWECPDTLA